MSSKVIASMTAGEMVARLGWGLEDVALNAEDEVTIWSDGHVDALERGSLIADVARLSSADLEEVQQSDECAYCGAPAGRSSPVPPGSDDEAWEALATLHGDACEWVQTRAHQVSR